MPDDRIGWIGLGKMGLPMAELVAAAGHGVDGFDISPDRIALAEAAGLTVLPRLHDAVSGHATVIASLPDDRALRGALLGPEGALAAMAPGAVLVETSTVSAEASAEVAQAAEAQGVLYLRAPVSGNASIVHTGALSCLASGPREGFDRVQPILASFTKAQRWLGPAEEARYAKLAVNLMIAVSAGMMAEALTLAQRGGVSRSDMLDVLAQSAVASPMVLYKVGPLAAEDFTSTFSCRQMAKDVDLVLGAARHSDVAVPLAALMRQTYAALIATGDGEEDFIATVRHAERLAGLARWGEER